MTGVIVTSEQFDQLTRDVSRLRAIVDRLSSDDRYMLLPEAAEYIRRSNDFLYRHKSDIGFYKDGKDLTFKKSDLDAYMESIYHAPENVGVRADS